MEQTFRQLVSDIITELKSVNIDDRMSNRFVLSRLLDKTKTIIKQDMDSRRLFKITSIWKTISCLDMCETEFSECACDIPNCEVVVKSKNKIPKVFDSNYGSLIKVFNVNGTKEYVQTTLQSYIDIRRREFQNPNVKYFWISDNHIYIPDSRVEQVMVQGLFENPKEVDVLNGIENAECSKPLDYLFPCPGHLLDAVKTATFGELIKGYKQIIEDEKPNENSNDKK